LQPGFPTGLTTFGEAEDGTLYAAAGSTVYKVGVVAESPTPIKLISFTLKQEQNFNDLFWRTAMEVNVKDFAIQYSLDAINFSDLTTIAATNNQNGSSYSFRHFTNNDQKIYYRLKSIDYDTHAELSRIISNAPPGTDNNSFTIYQKAGQSLQVQLGKGFHSFRIVNFVGQIMHSENIGGQSGLYFVNSTQWPKGMYILVADGTHSLTRKFMIQ
jgi:hypothetical protein